MSKVTNHIKTVLKHKYYVFIECCKLGIPVQGFMHDWSKFSPIEFSESIKYFTGTKSPLSFARQDIGYSKAWCHHVHCNDHHWEYYLDMDGKDNILPIPMPNHKIKEMIADRVAACRVYNPERWDYTQPLKYLMGNKDENIMHKETEEKLITCLTILSEQGSKGFKQVKEILN